MSTLVICPDYHYKRYISDALGDEFKDARFLVFGEALLGYRAEKILFFDWYRCALALGCYTDEISEIDMSSVFGKNLAEVWKRLVPGGKIYYL